MKKLFKFLKDLWHKVWATYHAERLDDPSEFTIMGAGSPHSAKFIKHASALHSIDFDGKAEVDPDWPVVPRFMTQGHVTLHDWELVRTKAIVTRTPDGGFEVLMSAFQRLASQKGVPLNPVTFEPLSNYEYERIDYGHKTVVRWNKKHPKTP